MKTSTPQEFSIRKVIARTLGCARFPANLHSLGPGDIFTKTLSFCSQGRVPGQNVECLNPGNCNARGCENLLWGGAQTPGGCQNLALTKIRGVNGRGGCLVEHHPDC